MDRRNFLSQSLVTAGTYAISFSTLASKTMGDILSVSLRPGQIGQKEFEAALSEATKEGKALILPPQAHVRITSNCTVGCSIVSSGGEIEISKGARMIVSGARGNELKLQGLKISGEVLITHEGQLSVTNNKIINNVGDGIVFETESAFEFANNEVSSAGHNVVIVGSVGGVISHNRLKVTSNDRQFVWGENAFDLAVSDNHFMNRSNGRPSIAIANDNDLNPNLVLKNNKLA